MLFPWESSKKNDFLSSSMALTLFILAFFEGTCGLSVMTLAQLLFQMYQKKESSELSKRCHDIYAILIVRMGSLANQ